MQVAGRLAFAPIGERISLKLVVMVIFAIQGVSIAILHFFLTIVGIWAFVILLGASAGALTLARTAMLADLYSGENYGRISSLQATMMRLATMSAPIGASLLYAASGNSYQLVLPILALLPFMSVAAIWRIE